LITEVRPNGLVIDTSAPLRQLISDEALQQFAAGLLVTAITESVAAEHHHHTLHNALKQTDDTFNGLLVAALALDAELKSIIDDDVRVFALAGFLSYRDRLSNVPLPTLQLPPLNPDGHYIFAVVDQISYLAVRLDFHPELGVAGHVRIALGGVNRQPLRLRAIEGRLERQVLTAARISTAVGTAESALNPPLSPAERERLSMVLEQFPAGS
jgi:hypothetical protein